jgi:hypothetical protein
VTYFWPDGQVIPITLGDTGDPAAFRWAGQVHPVQHIATRWRTDDHWWDGRVRREYFMLTPETGWLVIIYRDLTTNAWYLQRIYD